MKDEKYILDCCCGPRHMWYNKSHPNAVYMDKRSLEAGFNKHRPNCSIKPDILANFQNIPFPDNKFSLVVMDPPHLIRCGPLFNIGQIYGQLDKDNWPIEIRKGVRECYRVLKTGGVFIFKWSEVDISKKDILKAIKWKPLFGNYSNKNKTIYFVFMKFGNEIL